MRTFLLIPALTIGAIGCDAGNTTFAKKYESPGSPPRTGVAREANLEAPGLAMQGPEAGEFAVAQNDRKPAAAAKGGAAGAPPGAPAPEVSRKIIYTGTIELIVADFEAARKEVTRLVEQHEGYVSKSDVGEASGERRHATWVLRVPTAKFRQMMDALAGLGYATTLRTDSADVTDEFYDLEARLQNKREEEQRLRDHLQKSTGKLEDILAIEKELSRVRGEVESTQGRLQKLSKLAELTTITVSATERKDYVPPTAPTFGNSLGNTLSGSADALVQLGKFIALFVAALIPWLPLLALAGGAGWLVLRRMRRPVPTIPPVSNQPAGG